MEEETYALCLANFIPRHASTKWQTNDMLVDLYDKEYAVDRVRVGAFIKTYIAREISQTQDESHDFTRDNDRRIKMEWWWKRRPRLLTTTDLLSIVQNHPFLRHRDVAASACLVDDVNFRHIEVVARQSLVQHVLSRDHHHTCYTYFSRTKSPVHHISAHQISLRYKYLTKPWSNVIPPQADFSSQHRIFAAFSDRNFFPVSPPYSFVD